MTLKNFLLSLAIGLFAVGAMGADAPGGSPGPSASVLLEIAGTVKVGGPVPLRFRLPVAPDSLNDRSVVLFGPQGVVRGVVGEGASGFEFRPLQELQPNALYTVFVDGAKARDGSAISLSTASFMVAAASPISVAPVAQRTSPSVNGEWIPGPEHRTGNWRTSLPHVTVDSANALKARLE